VVFRTETEFVRWLRIKTRGQARGLRLGIGDDAAIVALSRGRDLLLKADMSIDGVHFTARLHPPRAVGHRALARSLSDIAAMGGTPRFALVSLALWRGTSREWIESFFRAMVALGRRFGVAVIGGDTAVLPGRTMIDVVVAGEVPRGKALLRSGARPGNLLFVSGRLGLSALGLRLLKSRPGRWRGDASRAIRAHLYPEPRCELGRFLLEKGLASALIDLSDGLSTDLGHLCQASGVGARVWADCIPLPDALNTRHPGRVRSLALALHGGEDYELLFAVPPRLASRIPGRFQGVPLHHIGEVSGSREVVLVETNGSEQPLRPGGYDHFRRLYLSGEIGRK
jgi:thiamine-monophosphate kinase